MNEVWPEYHLAELTTKVGSGSTPRGGSEAYKSTGVPLIRSMNVVFFGFKRKGLVYLDDQQAAQLAAVAVQAGDVLLNITGASIGRVTIAPPDLAGARVNQHVCIIRPNEAIEPRFLAAYLSAPVIQNQIASDNFGVTRQALTKQQVLDLTVPVPPIAEQTRIAAQLDALLTRVNACNDRLNAIPSILKRFRAAVANSALMGTLTDDCPDGLSAERKMTKISEVASVGTGSTPLRSNDSFYAESGTPWVTSAATGQPLIASADQFVTQAAIAAHRLKIYPKGTLLVAMYGEGKTRGQVSELAIEATINQACAAISVNEEKASRKYVKLALTANYLAMRELAEGGNQPNLNLSKIKDFEIPLLSLERQAEVVSRVEALLTFSDRIESRCAAMRAHAMRLAPQVLTKAFRGELVEQDSKDEPASVLLQRLAASQPIKAASSRGRPRTQLHVQPGPKPADWTTLPGGEWAAPADPQGQSTTVCLTAVLRAWGPPMPEREARLAALLCQLPRLFSAVLPAAQARQWSRLVGDDAKPLPANVPRIQPATNSHWGQAIQRMRARGDLIEEGSGDVTWALGPGAVRIDTAGWPDGRAGVIVAHLRAHGIESVLPSMNSAEQDFVNVRAA